MISPRNCWLWYGNVIGCCQDRETISGKRRMGTGLSVDMVESLCSAAERFTEFQRRSTAVAVLASRSERLVGDAMPSIRPSTKSERGCVVLTTSKSPRPWRTSFQSGTELKLGYRSAFFCEIPKPLRQSPLAESIPCLIAIQTDTGQKMEKLIEISAKTKT